MTQWRCFWLETAERIRLSLSGATLVLPGARTTVRCEGKGVLHVIAWVLV